jgi:hypothetical protein
MLRRAPAVLAFICLSVASPAFAGGTSGVYARAQTRIPSGPDNSDFNSGLTGPVSAACQSDDLIPLGTFSFASAQADFGDLHAYGFSNGGISGILQNAMGEAAWFDEITIAGSGQVLVSFTFALDGTLTQSLPGPFSPASVGLIAGNVGSGSDVASFQRLASPVPMTVNTSVTLGPYVVDTNVPTNLTMRGALHRRLRHGPVRFAAGGVDLLGFRLQLHRSGSGGDPAPVLGGPVHGSAPRSFSMPRARTETLLASASRGPTMSM